MAIKKKDSKKPNESKPSVFDQLMARMATTKLFPIDPQPISPMPPSGLDPIMEEMERRGLEMTRENYLALDNPEAEPSEIQENEADLPVQFQLNPASEDHSSTKAPPTESDDTKPSSESETIYERETLDGLQDQRPDLTREELKAEVDGYGF